MLDRSDDRLEHRRRFARRLRHAADMRALRSRRRRGVRLLKIEIGDREIGLAVRYAGLSVDQVNDADALSVAISRLLGKSLAALLNAEVRRSK